MTSHRSSGRRNGKDARPPTGDALLRNVVRPITRVLWRYQSLVLAWAVFTVLLGGFSWLIQWPPAGLLIRRYSIPMTADLCAWFLRILGADGRSDGQLVYSTVSTFRVIDECTAAYPMAVFCAAILAYPGRFLPKAVGLGLGLPAIVLVNQLRLVSLCYIEFWRPDLLDIAHMVAWQSLLAVFIVVMWTWWVVWLADGWSHDAA